MTDRPTLTVFNGHGDKLVRFGLHETDNLIVNCGLWMAPDGSYRLSYDDNSNTRALPAATAATLLEQASHFAYFDWHSDDAPPLRTLFDDWMHIVGHRLAVHAPSLVHVSHDTAARTISAYSDFGGDGLPRSSVVIAGVTANKVTRVEPDKFATAIAALLFT